VGHRGQLGGPEIFEVETHPIQAVPPLAIEAVHDIDSAPWYEVRGRATLVERKGLRGGGPITNLQAQVPRPGSKGLSPKDFEVSI